MSDTPVTDKNIAKGFNFDKMLTFCWNLQENVWFDEAECED